MRQEGAKLADGGVLSHVVLKCWLLLLAVVVVLVDVFGVAHVVKRDRKVRGLPMKVWSLTLF